jgi:hypothetical protein
MEDPLTIDTAFRSNNIIDNAEWTSPTSSSSHYGIIILRRVAFSLSLSSTFPHFAFEICLVLLEVHRLRAMEVFATRRAMAPVAIWAVARAELVQPIRLAREATDRVRCTHREAPQPWATMALPGPTTPTGK